MKFFLSLLVLFGASALTVSGALSPGNKNIGHIWFIGDSIMQGVADGDGNSSPRASLYQKLAYANYDFDYTGSFTADSGGLPPTGDTPLTNEYFYHDGHSGWGINSFTQGVGEVSALWKSGRLETVKPDIIIIMLGTNDINNNKNYSSGTGPEKMAEVAKERMEALLKKIYALPGIGSPTVILSAIPPNKTDANGGTPQEHTDTVAAYNKLLAELAADGQRRGNSIYFSDPHTLLNNDYSSAMRPDNLHTSARGNDLLAQAWFKTINSVVSPPKAMEPVDYIDPFVGTGHFGKTFPGAATPCGMVQLSPDTITGGDNGSGYRYYHRTIQGFSFTHMSGVGWFGDLGNFLVMPTTGTLKTWYGETNKPGTGYLSAFDKKTESASAGYYAVMLSDYKIKAELTAAPHSGILRFTFPQHEQSRIQIDLARRVGGTSLRQAVKVVDERTIEGFIECTREGGGWGRGAGQPNYTFYYRAEFSKPLKNFGVWEADIPAGPYPNRDVADKPGEKEFVPDQPDFIEACQNAKVTPGLREAEGRHLGFFSEFATREGEEVLMKVGVSFVSVEGARNNLRAEIPAWDFNKTHQQARALWAQALRRVTVSGGTEEQLGAFYTALYHVFIDPRAYADLNGDYTGGDQQRHSTDKFTKRTIFSGWDVYRSAFPLLTLIAPDIVNDMINSLVELAGQSGKKYLERWEFLNAYSGCMNGSPAVVVLNDAYQKGIRDYDVEKAYEFAKNTCDKNGNGPRGYRDSISETMENAHADWNLSQLAKALGKDADAEVYARRGQDYRNLFYADAPWTYDKAGTDRHDGWQGWIWAKDKEGRWLPWEGLTSHTRVTEGTVYQEGWAVPHDIPGLMELAGGRELFLAKLGDFFDRTPPLGDWSGPGRKGSNEVLTPYYNHPNEPVHLIPFMFNRAGAPWLTQKWVRQIDQVYQPGPEGLCGDEDVGQMSGWFVLAAAGLHPANPGEPRYEIFTPLFDRVVIQLDKKYASGKTFTISAANNSPENVYIQSARLNGKPLNRCWLTHAEIAAGGQLDLVLGPQPNERWGVE
ncbi:MAG: GH92 family glycosyl hydrolase [Verrucomicrobiales bacterium]|jgi:predicted alpha-1,2-mannosidase|nr:GH92 family glycosyl hydrolase [Verrucomicrobiales bacterium]